MNKFIELKKIVFISFTVSLLAFNWFQKAPKTPEQELSEKAILEWADKTFEYYDGPRFEKFMTIPTDQFSILQSKVESLKEYKDEMKQSYAAGEIKKTKEEFDLTLKKLDRKIDSLQTVAKEFPNKSTGFEIDFWANIMVNNALTVYYVHHIKLDKQYAITEAKITGSIGKENDQIKILYKKGQGK